MRTKLTQSEKQIFDALTQLMENQAALAEIITKKDSDAQIFIKHWGERIK